MKILCISDEIDPHLYSARIKERFDDVDIVLGAGDLPLDYLEFIVSTLNKPLLFVFGNHNLGDFDLYNKKSLSNDLELNLPRYFEECCAGAGAQHISGKVIREDGVLIAGLGGSMRYNSGENQFTNAAMRFEIFKLMPRLFFNKLKYGRYLDILLTHAPPEGIHDKDDLCHRGFNAFLWFMRRFKPRYLLHGHIHLYDSNEPRVTQYYDTSVINVFSHYVIEVA